MKPYFKHVLIRVEDLTVTLHLQNGYGEDVLTSSCSPEFLEALRRELGALRSLSSRDPQYFATLLRDLNLGEVLS